ncbi:hypothetical protein JB92DRAFT_2830284 [Gautieria morchelliformis]|nr:hypothetical protein JB92DRAFT_2830284 [Gautieria morchelliformis]
MTTANNPHFRGKNKVEQGGTQHNTASTSGLKLGELGLEVHDLALEMCELGHGLVVNTNLRVKGDDIFAILTYLSIYLFQKVIYGRPAVEIATSVRQAAAKHPGHMSDIGAIATTRDDMTEFVKIPPKTEKAPLFTWDSMGYVGEAKCRSLPKVDNKSTLIEKCKQFPIYGHAQETKWQLEMQPIYSQGYSPEGQVVVVKLVWRQSGHRLNKAEVCKHVPKNGLVAGSWYHVLAQ